MRKHTRRKVHRLVNPIEHAISGAAVTDTASLDKLRMRELSAIDAFSTGAAGRQEWMDLADMLNICETLAADGVGPEAREFCQGAQEALAAVHHRYHVEHQPVRFTGPELEVVRQAYGYHDLQRASISRARYEQAIKKTADRIRSSHPSVRVVHGRREEHRMIIDGEDGWEDMGDGTFIKHEPRVEVVPELPPEVHNTRPVDAERAMAAVRAMCG